MALRPLRNATISFGLVNIPVRFYTATKSEDVHFNLLHADCGSRVNRRWWCPQHENFIELADMIRGYPVAKNQYVTFTAAELEELESGGDRALEITAFVDLAQIDPVFFEKAYYLGPAPGGAKTYRLLAEAMRKQNKVAVARWVSNSREHLVVLRPFEEGLILHTMYYADEVRDFSAIDVDHADVRDKEVALAKMLIDELTEPTFDPLAYKDEYRERVMERIRAKAEGELVVSESPESESAGEVVDIMEALRRSLGGAVAEPRKRNASASAAAPATRKAPKRAAPQPASRRKKKAS
ncbi:MAG: Ku protein [Acidobacteria bacterium]|nr:Ku protein [Acidobacteriota bacterium]MBV9475779.1 Ku protein [Acidobacteriota bacterium]